MRLLFWLSVLVFIGGPLALAAAVMLCFEDRPLVHRAAEFTPEHIARAMRLLDRNDPRKMKSGTLRTLSIGGDELDLAANYLANRFGNGSARIVLQPGALALAASVEVPRSPFGRFVNVDAAVRETSGLPAFEHLSIGRLPVPGWLADMVLTRAFEGLNRIEEYQVAADAIRNVSIADGSLQVVYEWREDLPDRLRKVLLPPADGERLRIYQERLVQIAGNATTPRKLSLADLLVPLMQLASERSAAGDAQAESRAAIVVVAFYVNGKGLSAIVPGAKGWPRPAPRQVTLNGREDFPQHFSISAALAANAGAPLSDAIGLYKEVEDSRGGSGFSFNDIAADRAGTVFGELATRPGDGARALQQRVAAGLKEPDMMPDVADLPEFMPEADFKRRFGGIGAPAYNKMMLEIERRIAACALYRF